MLTLPNILTFLRFPLALVFLKQNTVLRLVALAVAMVTDGLDGFLARRKNQTTPFGALLDPLADRFFVFFTMGVMLFEERIEFWQASTLICRDISVLLFGFYLVFANKISTYRFRAIWCGKATTFMQFLILLGLILNTHFPNTVFAVFIVLGMLALFELYFSKEQQIEVGANSQ